MDTGIGDRENTGQHLHLTTKVCVRDQMARPPDQHQQVYRNNQPESERLRSKWLKFVRHCSHMNNYTLQLVKLLYLSIKTNFERECYCTPR